MDSQLLYSTWHSNSMSDAALLFVIRLNTFTSVTWFGIAFSFVIYFNGGPIVSLRKYYGDNRNHCYRKRKLADNTTMSCIKRLFPLTNPQLLCVTFCLKCHLYKIRSVKVRGKMLTTYGPEVIMKNK